MKALYSLAFGLFGHFVAVAAPPVHTASHTIYLTGQRYYAYPAAQVCNSDFAQSDDNRELPGGGGGWNSGNQSYTSTAIPKNMSVKSVAVTVNFNTQIVAPITLKLNNVAAATIYSQAGILRDGCQTATFVLPVSAYVDGGLNTVNMTVGANAVLAVSTETVTITYSNGKNDNGGEHGGLVQICHKGDAIYVSSNAVPAHLAHGDNVGDCPTAAKAAPDVATELSVSPNPATDQVAFSFRSARAGKAQVQVYNQWGKLVATVYSRESAAGELNVVPFDSQQLPEGLYLCRLVTSTGVQTTRLTLTK